MVISKEYIPKQGDIVWLDFTPHQAGHEQAGKHPALIVCNDAFFEKTNLIIACPISSQEKRFPLHLPLPKTCKTNRGILNICFVSNMCYITRLFKYIAFINFIKYK